MVSMNWRLLPWVMELEYEVELRYKPGFKRFQVPHMLPFDDLLWEILEMQEFVEARP